MAKILMTKHANLILGIVFFLISGIHLNAKEIHSNEYCRYVNEITKSFAKEMENDFDLFCIGSGGRMPHDVEKIEVLFVAHRKTTLEEARKMEVKGVQNLLKKINTHEKIRPYLREYPFKSDRVDVSISFQTKEDYHITDGSVTLVYLVKNKVIYRAAEMRKEKSYPGYDCRDPNNIIYFPPREKIEEELIPLFEEPYEEALKIVLGSASPGDKYE